jgi:gamma-butyrobetaine hydroxylase
MKAIPPKATSVDIIDDGKIIAIQWPDQTLRFHAIWLRDNGQDENTKNLANFQKLFTIQDIPLSTVVSSATFTDQNHLNLAFQPDHWNTNIDLDWLHSHSYDSNQESNSFSLFENGITIWDSSFSEKLPTADYEAIRTQPEALLRWLEAIDRYGVATLSGLPDKNASVLDVIDLFGFIRETNYGEYFEIRSEINPVNMAYTKHGLQSHTDNPYRHPVPGLQFFGCLANDADGGDSVVVDGFQMAQLLYEENPGWFKLLSQYNASFEYKGSNNTHLRSCKPMIECGVDAKVQHIRFNNRSCDALTQIPFEHMSDYYDAYRHFGELANSNQLEVKFKLAPGELFVTDNTRVLHGRTGFSGSGHRWMQGAYADLDSLQSKIRILQRECE